MYGGVAIGGEKGSLGRIVVWGCDCLLLLCCYWLLLLVVVVSAGVGGFGWVGGWLVGVVVM